MEEEPREPRRWPQPLEKGRLAEGVAQSKLAPLNQQDQGPTTLRNGKIQNILDLALGWYGVAGTITGSVTFCGLSFIETVLP
jgi:hypothetical protein